MTASLRLALPLLLIVGLMGGALVGLKTMTPLTTYSYAKNVPVSVGYQPAQNYWILSSVVNEKEEFKMVLPDQTSVTADAGTQVKAGNEIGLVIGPLRPYSETGLIFLNRQYLQQRDFLGNTKDEFVPGYDIDDTSWLTTARYWLQVNKGGFGIADKFVDINYQKPSIVTIPVEDKGVTHTVTVNNLGMIPQGVEVPSGDLVVVEDTRNGKSYIWSKDDLTYLMQRWADNRGGKTGTWQWADVLSWAESTQQFPQSAPLVHIETVTYTASKIKMIYGGIVFAGNIAIYIPAALADTVTINLFAPKPVIKSVSPDPLPALNEGESAELSVAVKNDGTDGTVSASVTSGYYQFAPITASSIEMKAGAENTFKFRGLALEVTKDETPKAEIFVQGRGGTDSRQISGAIKNLVRTAQGDDTTGLTNPFEGWGFLGGLGLLSTFPLLLFGGLGVVFLIIIIVVVGGRRR